MFQSFRSKIRRDRPVWRIIKRKIVFAPLLKGLAVVEKGVAAIGHRSGEEMPRDASNPKMSASSVCGCLIDLRIEMNRSEEMPFFSWIYKVRYGPRCLLRQDIILKSLLF